MNVRERFTPAHDSEYGLLAKAAAAHFDDVAVKDATDESEQNDNCHNVNWF